MTHSPHSEAASRSHWGGTVYVRMALMPFSAINAKSRSTVAKEWYSLPFSSGRNGP